MPFVDVKNSPKILITVSVAEYKVMPLWLDMYYSIHQLGGCPVVIDTTVEKIDHQDLIDKVDGLIIGGGQDINPKLYGGDTDDPLLSPINDTRDSNEARLYQLAIEANKPVLGICRGMQLMNVLGEGTLMQDVRRDHGGDINHDDRNSPDPNSLRYIAHSLSLKNSSLLYKIVGEKDEIEVNSGHHQAIAKISDQFTACAWAPDGIVEAIEPIDKKSKIIGIQWHPENIYQNQESSRNILSWFIKLCTK